MKRIFEVDPWKLISHTFKADGKRLQESLTAIGNDYMGLRGNFEEGYSGDSLQGTYYAGVWFPDKTRVGWWKNGYPEYFGKSLNAPSFINIDLTINGEKVDLAKSKFTDFYLELDMHQGLLTRSYILDQGKNQVKLTFKRFLSNHIKEAALIKVDFEVLKGQADIAWKAYLDGTVVNEDSNYEEHFWDILKDDSASLQAITKANNFGTDRFTVYLKQAMKLDGEKIDDFSGEIKLANGQKASLEKDVVVITSRDVEADKQEAKADELLAEVTGKTFEENLALHEAIWKKRWEGADVEISGDPDAQQGIRFNILQLFMTYYGEDPRLNIGPKGFTGEKYGGATYWDTEAYIVPMYLATAPSSVTKSLLEYRHAQLPGAYHNARQQGLAGALFPMVTFTGVECHNEWEITFEEIHRNADIPFAIYQYTEYTGDDSYVKDEGMDVLVGTARFWADRVHFSKRKNQYMIHGVTGPNEYENNVNNNWFTNTMAKWLLSYTIERLPLATKEAQARVDVSKEELAHWQDIVDKMYLPEDKELGIFVQHDTFLDKDLTPVKDLDPKVRPLNQHWSWDKILRSPYIKQADVLQGIYFLNDQYTMEQKEKNFDFYEPLTVHESSLSPSIHSILAAELGKQAKAVEMYQRTARLDLDNYNNDTDDGLHITSMSGSWLAIVQGFAGMRYDHNLLKFKPFVPESWDGYNFKFNYRGRLIKVEVEEGQSRLTILSGDDLDVKVGDKQVTLKEGEQQCFKD
ncbi:MAG: glycoside hydrolase family 65 protein [Lactobacillus sp.]|nr:glycoside hydrolase family 65 protein [Lactobacillus sp.]